MNINDCIRFANANPICHLATIDKGMPRVRILGFWFADESGFYFVTSENKEMTRQLRENPNAEACFYKHEGVIGTMLRISGKIQFVTDRSLKEKAFVDRPYLTSYGLTVDSPELILFRIGHGQAYFWTMESNSKPKDYINF